MKLRTMITEGKSTQKIISAFDIDKVTLKAHLLKSYVRESQGNGIAGRFVRILKENYLWLRSFRTVEELRLAFLAFKATSNRQWWIARHGYRSPAQVREGQ